MLWISFSNYFSGTVPNDTAARYMIQVPSRDQYEAIPHLVPYGSFVTPHNSGIKSLLDVQNCTYTSERCEINKREVIDHWSEDIHRWRGRCSSLDGVVTGVGSADWLDILRSTRGRFSRLAIRGRFASLENWLEIARAVGPLYLCTLQPHSCPLLLCPCLFNQFVTTLPRGYVESSKTRACCPKCYNVYPQEECVVNLASGQQESRLY